jgi:hypothetical protein
MGLTNNLGKLSNMITSTGSAVGIAQTSPSYTLDVSGTGRFTSTLLVSGAATFSSSVGIVGAAGTNGSKLFVQGSASCLFDAAGTRGISFYPSQSSVHFITSDYIGTSYYPLALSARGVNSDLYLSTSGNVGIGTSNPAYPLDVQTASGNTYLNIGRASQSTGQVALQLSGGTSGVNWIIYQNTSDNDLRFYGNSAERMRITSGGFFKASNNGSYLDSNTWHEIRQSNNTRALVIQNSSASFTSTVLVLGSATSASASYNLISGDDGAVGQFRVSGNGVIYAQNTSVQSISDIRTKENIINSNEGLNVITALRAVRFDFKEGFGNNRKNQLGFIAQEVEEIFPDAVGIWGESDEENNPYKSLGTASLIPVLVKAIQELNERLNKAGL